jgi:hypothetical protein
MSWTFVFLSYVIPPALLSVLLMLDWVQRDTGSRPSLVTREKPKYIHGIIGEERKKKTIDGNRISSRILKEANGIQGKELVSNARCLR